MGSVWGNKLKVSIFGESHGEGIGVVIDNLPPGIKINMDYINKQLSRRAPGKSPLSTSRREGDSVKILSGVFKGYTTGAPLCGIIYNEDQKSKDYSQLKDNMRPGHSDYPAWAKYAGFNDYRGGGHFSGRLTAPLLFAGALAMHILETYRDIFIASHIKSISHIEDDGIKLIDYDAAHFNYLKDMEFPVLSEEKGELMKAEILKAKESGDSLGGTVGTIITNIPAGYGDPFFNTVESKLSHMIFSIPGIKGIEFGAGFNITKMRGSSANDTYIIKDGKISTKTNNNGGIIGGITNGMPVVFTTAVKPTSSIALPQETVNIDKMEETVLQINGRHDPCIVPRVIPVIEGASALVILDLLMERDGEKLFRQELS
ncbi:MAG TPA: chorismate synthase [Tissierellia bacterium]|nr:chorismate synthase [Tissierellia bacterium]